MSHRCLTPALVLMVSLVSLGCGTQSPKPAATGVTPSATPAPASTSASSAPVAPAPASSTPAPGPPAPLPAIDVSKTAPVISVSADEFVENAVKDPTGTDAKYMGKVIQVEGNVSWVARRIEKKEVTGVTMRISSKKGQTLLCTFTDPQAWKEVARGSRITLKGRWSSFAPVRGMQELTLTDCLVLEAGPCSRITTTPDELSADYASLGSDEFFKKYNQKDVIVEGEVRSHEQASSGAHVVVFKTSTMPYIGFDPNQVGKREASNLKAQYPIGQTISFHGFYWPTIRSLKNDSIFWNGTDDIIDY
jgi:hypothetical protein